jgi:hypothetical protein
VRASERGALVALSVGLLLLTYPLLNLPNMPVLVLGVPLLYLYLFAVWLAGIGVAWLLSRNEE